MILGIYPIMSQNSQAAWFYSGWEDVLFSFKWSFLKVTAQYSNWKLPPPPPPRLLSWENHPLPQPLDSWGKQDSNTWLIWRIWNTPYHTGTKLLAKLGPHSPFLKTHNTKGHWSALLIVLLFCSILRPQRHFSEFTCDFGVLILWDIARY